MSRDPQHPLYGWGIPICVAAFCGVSALGIGLKQGNLWMAAGGALAAAPLAGVLAWAWVTSWWAP